MGVRHRSLPIWGVQVHPESISSRYGRELLANFRDLTIAHQHRRVQVTPNQVHVRRVPTAVDAEQAYTKLFSGAAHSFWLDSGSAGTGTSRFSMMGDDSGPFAEYLTYSVADRTVTVYRQGQAPEVVGSSFFDYLDGQLRHRALPAVPGLPTPFNLGYVGYGHRGHGRRADRAEDHHHHGVAARMLQANRLPRQASSSIPSSRTPSRGGVGGCPGGRRGCGRRCRAG